MAARFRQFRGGYRFGRFAGAPGPEKVELGIPETVRLSLIGSGGKPMPLLVKMGQSVRAGQMVAQGGAAPSSPLLAPVSGTVQSVSKGGGEMVIRSDGMADLEPLERRYGEWHNVSRDRLEDALYMSGITGFPAAGIPTRRSSSLAAPEEVEHVLVEATHAELWSPRLSVLLEGRMEAFAAGFAILAKLLPTADFTLVMDRSEAALAARIRGAVAGAVSVLAVRSRYPLNHEAILLQAVMDRRLAAGQSAIEAGVLVMDVETIVQIHDVVVKGTPPVERLIALAGAGFARPLYARVRLGTPIGAIVARFGAPGVESRLVVNSPLSGETVSDLGRGVDPRCRLLAAIPENHDGEILSFARPGFVKDSYSRTFVANFLPFTKRLDTSLRGEGRACISCGFCEEVCPARIMPQLLHRYVKRNVIDEAILRYRITDCIDCNLCSYVCPSKIPVAELLRRGKSRLVEEGLVGAAPAAEAADSGKGR